MTALVLLFAFVCSTPALSEDLKVVKAEGRAYLGEDTTPAEARAVSLNNARRNALEEAVGVTVHGSSVIYNSSLISDLVVAATKGLIVDERILESRWDETDGRMAWYTSLEATVRPIPSGTRGNLRITSASVQRPDKGAYSGAPVFQDSDEVQIRVKVSGDSYLNIFNVDQNGSVLKLYPNDFMEAGQVPAGGEFVFPDDSQRTLGLRLRVNTLKGLRKSVESVLVIATSRKVDFLTGGGVENPTISDLMRELSALDLSVWAEKTLGYEVRKN